MKIQRICIGNIPALIWGEKSSKLYVHVHGKTSCKEDAAGFAELAEKKAAKHLALTCRNMVKEQTQIIAVIFGMVCMIFL